MACNFIKKETLAQVFSCEFCEVSKNTFFYRIPLVAASEICHNENTPGFLVIIDFEQAFDSLDYDFYCVLKKFDFGDNFITWIET